MAETTEQIIGGRYALLERVGRGGLGVVYRALDRRLDRVVAVKFLAEHLADDPAAMRRLEHEARATAGLNSPHVVPIFDFGVEAGQPYLVMEYLAAGTLAAQVAGRLPLPADEVVRYGRQIAAGLAAAHARGIVHRDVTLRNVLVAPDGALKVADFGIAKSADSPTLTRTGLAMGTVVAMAPEQVEGRPVSPATDVYGLGVALFELATGRPPFVGNNEVAVALQHMRTPPPSARDLNSAVPEGLAAIIARALAKDPAARYADGAAIEAALAGSSGATPVSVLDTGDVVTTPLPRLGGLGAAPSAGAPPPAAATSRLGAGRRWTWPVAALAGLAVLLLTAVLAGGRGAFTLGIPAEATARPPVIMLTRGPATLAPSPPSPTAALPTPPVAPASVTSPTAPVAMPTRPAPPTPTAVPPPATKPRGDDDKDKQDDKDKKDERSRGGGRGQIDLDNTAYAGGFSNPGDSRYADRTGERRTATWIYGARSRYPAMTARFRLDRVPTGEARLELVGMDAEGTDRMPLKVTLNATVIYEGANPLPDWRWGEATLRVPVDALKVGDNVLEIRSLAPVDNFGVPPFFMLDTARLAWEG